MNRRKLIQFGLASAGSLWALSRAGAQTGHQCFGGATPRQPEGPFYPVVDQVDKDADLVSVAGRTEIARGEIVLIEGNVTDQDCEPVQGALVEIWQACESGRYNHPSDPNDAPLDPNFQYWGRAVTDQTGFYRFRTIIPGAYPASSDWVRPPHIHFKISRLGYRELITQMYFAGNALNAQDLILQGLSKEEQAQVIVETVTREGLPHPVGVFPIQMTRLTGSLRRAQ